MGDIKKLNSHIIQHPMEMENFLLYFIDLGMIHEVLHLPECQEILSQKYGGPRKICPLERAYSYLGGRVLSSCLVRKIFPSNTDHIQIRSLNTENHKTGKPFVEINQKEVGHLSISHSGKWVVSGFSLDKIIGVDLEDKKNVKKTMSGLFLNDEELNFLLTRAVIEEDFLALVWTAKEAMSKALGFGLTVPIKDFTVVLSETDLMSFSEGKSIQYQGCYQKGPDFFKIESFSKEGFVCSCTVKL